MGSVEIEKQDGDQPTSMCDVRQTAWVRGQVVEVTCVTNVHPLVLPMGECLMEQACTWECFCEERQDVDER